MLLEWVKRLGTGNWEEIASHIEGRSAGKCRERYTNYIGPDVKIKAAGGIRTRPALEAFLSEGCDRVGASCAVEVLRDGE